MADDEYELLPHAELEYLRKEVERLKRNPLGDTHASMTLLMSMNELNKNLSQLVSILKSANDDMVRAFKDNSVQEQIRKLRDENAKIAHGIVALVDLVKDLRSENPQPMDQAPDPGSMDPVPDLDTEDFSQHFSEDNPFTMPEEPMPPLPKRDYEIPPPR